MLNEGKKKYQLLLFLLMNHFHIILYMENLKDTNETDGKLEILHLLLNKLPCLSHFISHTFTMSITR